MSAVDHSNEGNGPIAGGNTQTQIPDVVLSTTQGTKVDSISEDQVFSPDVYVETIYFADGTHQSTAGGGSSYPDISDVSGLVSITGSGGLYVVQGAVILGTDPTADVPLIVGANYSLIPFLGSSYYTRLQTHYQGSGPVLDMGMSHHSDTAYNGPNFYIQRSRGTQASRTAVVNGDDLGTMYVNGWDGSSYYPGLTIDTVVSGTVSSGQMPATTTIYINQVPIMAISSAGIQLPIGASTGYVLTSDASGNATWQVSSSYPDISDSSGLVSITGSGGLSVTNGPLLATNGGTSGAYVIASNVTNSGGGTYLQLQRSGSVTWDIEDDTGGGILFVDSNGIADLHVHTGGSLYSNQNTLDDGSGNQTTTGSISPGSNSTQGTAIHLFSGTGAPISITTMVLGDLYFRVDGGTLTTLYRYTGPPSGWVGIL